MHTEEKAIIDRLRADYSAELYKCRWSKPDVERVVPDIIKLLSSTNNETVDEALRMLCLIGTPAELAAPEVIKLIQSNRQLTKRLAVLALGAIAHREPDLCVVPIASALNDPACCRDALRILGFLGPDAISVIDQVNKFQYASTAKVRKAATKAAERIRGI